MNGKNINFDDKKNLKSYFYKKIKKIFNIMILMLIKY